MKDVFICSAVRTPLGSFGGMFAGLSATTIGSAAIKGALEKAQDKINNTLNSLSGHFQKSAKWKSVRTSKAKSNSQFTLIYKKINIF